MTDSLESECGILAIDVLRASSVCWETPAHAANQAVVASRSLMEKYMISSSLLGRVDVVATSDLQSMGYFETSIANWLSESGNVDFEFQCSSTLNSLGTLSNALNWANSTLGDKKLSLLISADAGEVVVVLLGESSSFKFDSHNKTTGVTKTTQQLASLVTSFASKSTNAHFLRKNTGTQLLKLDHLLLEVSGVSGADEIFNYVMIDDEGMLEATFKQKYLAKVKPSARPSPTAVWNDLIQLIVDHGEDLAHQHVVLCSRTSVRTTLQSILPSANTAGNAQFSLAHMQSVLRASLYAQQEALEELGLTVDTVSVDDTNNTVRTRFPRSDTEVWASGRPNVKVVVTGISAALPGRNGDVFTPGVNNIRRIIEGECFISPIPDAVKDAMLEKNVITQNKDASGKLVNTPVSTYAQGINVSASLGNINLSNYGIANSIAATMDTAVQVSIAAGLEALKDAGLVTGIGAGTSGWELPEAMQSTTGVVYATSFPALDTAIAEVSKFFAAKEVSSASVPHLMSELRGRLLKNILDGHALSPETEAALVELEAVATEATLNERPVEPYAFDRKFLFRVLVLGNAQLAQIVKARGPNMQTNAACAGATQAIALAYDMIQVGRAERVIVIAGDSASSDTLMPWLGNGFRILGAATISSDLALAAKPFGAERTGMILGSGGIGMVLESEAGARRRHAVTQEALRQASATVLQSELDSAVFHSNSSDSAPGSATSAVSATSALTVTPTLAATPLTSSTSAGRAPFRCRLLGTLLSNSAYHGAAMDKVHIAEEFERFVSGIEAEHGVSRQDLARHGVYFSHETGTHASPSSACAANEIYALRKVFGASLSDLLILNTKGFTGHPMGVSFEDVVAVEVLNTGMVPPIANFTTVDPHLGRDLKLSRGGAYPCKYAIRFAAGFGSQIALALYGVA